LKLKILNSNFKVNFFHYPLLYWIVLLLIFLYASFSQAAGTVSVKPLTIDLELSSNKKAEFEIEIYSTSPREDASIHISLFDAIQKESGGMDFGDIGKSPYSCAQWIRFEKTDFIVHAGETVTIKGEVLVPAANSGSRLAAIMVEPGYDKKAKGISIRLRYAVVLRLRVKGRPIIEQAEIEKLGVKKLSDDVPAIEAVISNKSEIDFIAKGRVTLQDDLGKIVSSMDLTTESLEHKKQFKKKEGKRLKGKGKEEDDGQKLFPGAKVAFFGKIDKPLPAGEYTATINLKYGKRSLVTKQKVKLTEDMMASLSKGSGHNAASFEVKPEDLEIKGQAGGVRSAVFNITNITEEPIKVVLSVKDLEYSPDGETVIKEKGSTPYSSSDWIGLGETEYTIGSKLSQGVPVKLNIPASVQPGGKYSLIVVEKARENAGTGAETAPNAQASPDTKSASNAQTVPNAQSAQTEISMVEVAAIIPGEVEPAAEITKFEQVNGKEMKNKGGNNTGNPEFALDVKNNGLMHLVPKGRIKIKDIYNHDVEEVELVLLARAILPQTIGKMTAVLQRKLIPGEYVAFAEVDYGGKERATSKITFTINAQK